MARLVRSTGSLHMYNMHDDDKTLQEPKAVFDCQLEPVVLSLLLNDSEGLPFHVELWSAGVKVLISPEKKSNTG